MTIPLSWMRGGATALVTPFRRDGSIDADRLRWLVERQIEAGVKLLVPCGTTGESATMTEAERLEVIRNTVEIARAGGARVLAGTGSNSTAATVEFTRRARDLGADAALIVAPYYNKPTQEGLFAHFSEVARSVPDLPIVLYNVPGRTASNLSAATTVRLAESFESIVAIKEASGDLAQIMELLATRPRHFRVLSGDDAMALPLIALGADGLVSVLTNELPEDTVRMVEEALAGSWEEARRIHFRLLPLMQGNFLESSPAPCKYVMSAMGLMEGHLRLPLVPVSAETRAKLLRILDQVGVRDHSGIPA